jgi:integrase/recombinase XerD
MVDPASAGHWIRRFLMEYAVSERNLSANTCASYRDMLVLLLPYAAKRKGVTTDALSVTDLSAELVRGFLVYLERERQCCTATRNQRLASIHALARFIGEHSPQHIEWCAQIRMVPIKKSMTASLTYLEKSEVDSLLAAPDQSSSQGRRDHALLLFLYNSGARVSEATSLRIGDIDWHSKSVRITGKGNKQRRCPLWPATLKHLHQLVSERPAEAYLFLNCRGEPLTRYGIHTLVERYIAKLRSSVPSLQGKRTSRYPAYDSQPSPAGGCRHQYDPRLARACVARYDQHLRRDGPCNEKTGVGDISKRKCSTCSWKVEPTGRDGIPARALASSICGVQTLVLSRGSGGVLVRHISQHAR